ncbi:MAG: flavodoxin family protein [Candidatus Thorarchaeota archaeon]|nr:flavodoxin family protein [Candidatus Thorarchaeota archaeon]
MRVLALNGSPTSERGATFGVLFLFIKGMENAGADVELVHVSKLKVTPCRGCFTCWTKTPGECIQRDDMDELLPKFENADVIVYGTPVYVDGVT